MYGLPNRRVSKKYKEKMDERNNEGFVQAIKSRMEQLIDEIIENHLIILFKIGGSAELGRDRN